MSNVVANVPEDPATEYSYRRIPVIEEYYVCQFVEGCCEGNEECGRHDQAILVHGKEVVDTVKEEVSCDPNTVVWQVS